MIASLTLLSALSNVSHAQQVTGNLQGRLVDSLGQAVSNANIIVSGPNVQGVRAATSDEDGSFNLLALPTGIVSVNVSHVRYQRMIFEAVSIELGRTANLGEVQLRSRLHDLPEVIILGNKQFIDPTSTSSGANLRSSDIEYLPIDRNYRSIATLIPQANVSYLDDEVNVAGATGRENKYFVDGVDVTDPTFSKVGTNLPYNFIKEIDVTTGGYEAEYRSTFGGLINVITYSGGNELHGSAFGFFTNNGLAASRRGGLLDPTQGAFSNYDVGVGLGGPIVHDELWFYVAYNPTFERKDVEIPGFGVHLDRVVTHSFAGKFTWRASPRLNFILTSTGDPSVRKAIGDIPPLAGTPARLENPDPFLSEVTGGGVNLSLNGSYVLSESILLDASISRVARDQTSNPSTERGRKDTVLIDTETGSWSGGGFGHLSFFRSSTTARTSGSVLIGQHTFKGGIEYRNNVQDVDLDGPFMYFRHSDTLYSFLTNGTRGKVENRIYSGYIQDNWQIADDFQIHLGLRLDGQDVMGGNGKVVHRIRGPWQPRIGFVFQPDQQKKRKIFASFGRFTQEWTSAVMTIYTGTQYFYLITYDRDPRLGGYTADTLISDVPGIPDETTLEGQHYDELNLGYETIVGETMKLRVQGTYRSLREAIVFAPGFASGNPGKGGLSQFPRHKHDYTALEITFERRGAEHFDFLASYVLSRNSGNYEGLYDSYNRNIVPNVRLAYSQVDPLRNATGPLPNDRTHALKFSGSYRFDFGLSVGTSFTWQSGTPLSDMAGLGVFLQPRGAVGRTPNIWDLNARVVYSFPTSTAFQTRLILDIFHIASRREPVDFVQQHYALVDESGNPNPASLNALYGVARRYQPPMSARLGLELNF
ncbi:MAG: TonB-dependent receptor [Ignavibacteriales bacterium]|nr:TonB-dependent receptor [Ignavibacteriales bacterium]